MKNKNKTKHFFYDSMLSIVFFIVYFAIFAYQESVSSGLGILFVITLLSYFSALVLPEYVDIKKNSNGSKVIMWLLRIMFLLGVIYAIIDMNQPCDWLCFRGLKGLVALVGLIVFPLIIITLYLLITWILKKNKKVV